MTASESDALLAEPLPTSALSRCPEPDEEGMWDKPRSPHQRVPIPGRAGFLAHPSGRLIDGAALAHQRDRQRAHDILRIRGSQILLT